jgi:hypothetical protein
VEPEVTVIGPLIVTVGFELPELWHIVHVDPLFPDAPETPFGYASAEVVRQTTASTIIAATERGSFRCIVLLLNFDWGGDSSAVAGSTACLRADTRIRALMHVELISEQRPESQWQGQKSLFRSGGELLSSRVPDAIRNSKYRWEVSQTCSSACIARCAIARLQSAFSNVPPSRFAWTR